MVVVDDVVVEVVDVVVVVVAPGRLELVAVPGSVVVEVVVVELVVVEPAAAGGPTMRSAGGSSGARLRGLSSTALSVPGCCSASPSSRGRSP